MNQSVGAWDHLENLAWRDVLIIAAALILARLLVVATQWTLRRMAANSEPRRRLAILRIVPIARLLIRAAAVVVIVPFLVTPTVSNLLAVSAGTPYRRLIHADERWPAPLD